MSVCKSTISSHVSDLWANCCVHPTDNRRCRWPSVDVSAYVSDVPHIGVLLWELFRFDGGNALDIPQVWHRWQVRENPPFSNNVWYSLLTSSQSCHFAGKFPWTCNSRKKSCLTHNRNQYFFPQKHGRDQQTCRPNSGLALVSDCWGDCGLLQWWVWIRICIKKTSSRSLFMGGWVGELVEWVKWSFTHSNNSCRGLSFVWKLRNWILVPRKYFPEKSWPLDFWNQLDTRLPLKLDPRAAVDVPTVLVRNLNSIWSLDKGFLTPLQGPKARSQKSGSVNLWRFVFSTSLPDFIFIRPRIKTENRFEGFYRVSLQSEYLGPFHGPKRLRLDVSLSLIS